jgi:hypothetical protein
MSPELGDFLRFVDANHFSVMTDQEYNSMTPAEWAWILGKAFETEFEWAFTNTNISTRDSKMRYLDLLWEELLDYVTDVSARYSEHEYSAPYLRTYLMHGFYGFDQHGAMAKYYQWLSLNSPIPTTPLNYASGYPAGGQKSFPEGYRRPWTMSFESFAGIVSIEEGRYLEYPSEVYTKHFYPQNEVLSGNIVSGKAIEESELEETELGDPGPLVGVWRLEVGSNYSEWSFSGGPKSGSFSATNYVNGRQSKSVSGQYEGYRKENGEYYEYKLYHGGQESRLVIIEDKGSSMVISVWGSRIALKRVG